MVNSYKDLIVWQKSIDLVSKIYEITENFPKHELFGLTSQIRRSAVSIPSNIAEGFNRKHRKEFAQFISIAFGSGAELETQILVAKSLKFLKDSDFIIVDKTLNEIMKMLNKLRSNLLGTRY